MADEGLKALFDDPEEQRAYEEFCANQERGLEPFNLDAPALVCRWRMHNKRVPLLNRHIRALSQRSVQGEPLTHNMLSWAKQHVEWSLTEGSYTQRDGVLMLVIDVNGNAAMSVGDYEPLAATNRASLADRARLAQTEEGETGVAPEVLCAVAAGQLLVAAGEHGCGALTLVEQLASTQGVVSRRAALEEVLDASCPFLVSDEHGVVVADDLDERAAASADADFARFLHDGVAKLF